MLGDAEREVKRIDSGKPTQNNIILCFQLARVRNMNMAYLNLLLRVLQSWSQGVNEDWVSYENSDGKEFTSKLT